MAILEGTKFVITIMEREFITDVTIQIKVRNEFSIFFCAYLPCFHVQAVKRFSIEERM